MKKYLTIILTAMTALVAIACSGTSKANEASHIQPAYLHHQTGIAYAHHHGALTASGIRGMNTGIDNLFEIGAGKENFEWG